MRRRIENPMERLVETHNDDENDIYHAHRENLMCDIAMTRLTDLFDQNGMKQYELPFCA